jgi:putative ATP-binding cassette transporter
VLSLSEQQMLSFARLLLAAPRYAVLDRPEAVLDPEVVARAFGFLAAVGISVLIFSSEPALAGRHDARIALADDGSWSFEPLHRVSATS